MAFLGDSVRRARSQRGEVLASVVDLNDPRQLVVPCTQPLRGLFFQSKPARLLMIGPGGAGFHRRFAAAFPQTLLQSVELDPKVLEPARSRMAFVPTDRTPVALRDGRMLLNGTARSGIG